MRKFENYLSNLGYAPDTRRGHRNSAREFLEWCKAVDVKPSRVSLNKMYEYIEFCRDKGNSERTVKGKVGILKHYFNALGRKANPASQVILSKVRRDKPNRMLDKECLEQIYADTIARTVVQKRDKMMLGLVIFQGLTRTDLSLLDVEHIDFELGKLYVPASAKQNARWLDLSAAQTIKLYEYVDVIRPHLLAQSLTNHTSKLFFSMGRGSGINNAVARFLKQLKKDHDYIIDLKQLRESRITIWVKEHGVVKANLFCGHKYFCSTTRYRTSDRDELRDKFVNLHPMELM